MKFTIKHESRGRMRVHMEQYRMTYEQADTLLYVIHNHRNVTFVKVYDRTADAVIEYVGDREQIIELLRHFHYESANVPQTVIKTSGRELNNSYQEKLIGSVVWHYSKKLLLPLPIRIALTIGRSVKYIGIGLKCLLQRKIEVPVLDATAITVSLITKDFSTASSIMFLLGIGELLEEWTHKKSVDDLARSMSLNVSKVWLRTPENQEILVESSKIEKGDKVVVHMGNVIPFDGEVLDGDAMVNQASLTGESVPVRRTAARGIRTGGHVILGLPGESREDLIKQAERLSELPLTTLKMHQLQLIRGTRMAHEYALHPEEFHLFSADEYIDLVIDYVEHLRPDLILERFVSQSPRELLIAPDWGLKNHEFTDRVKKRMKERDAWQGKAYRKADGHKNS